MFWKWVLLEIFNLLESKAVCAVVCAGSFHMQWKEKLHKTF